MQLPAPLIRISWWKPCGERSKMAEEESKEITPKEIELLMQI